MKFRAGLVGVAVQTVEHWPAMPKYQGILAYIKHDVLAIAGSWLAPLKRRTLGQSAGAAINLDYHLMNRTDCGGSIS